MGVVVSSNAATKEQKRQHDDIEKLLAAETAQNVNLFKMLLLGTGDSGKSTIVKQMRILHKNGFGLDELTQQRTLVAWNILHSLANIFRAMNDLEIALGHPELEPDVTKILRLEKRWIENGTPLTDEDWARMKKLWADVGVQECYARSHEYQLSDSTKYFCDDLDRICEKDYVPTEQDVLRIRIPTTSIVEIEFSLRNLTVKVIDVGGQRSQRRKWIHCFDNVNSIIFICAASEYNQVLLEDHHVNRIHESLKLFGTVINSQWFVKASAILFLNKKDLFEEKIKSYPLTIAFPEYTGASTYEEAMDFVQLAFEKQRTNRKTVYSHRTCATDTKNIEFVLDACFDMLVSKNISKSGII